MTTDALAIVFSPNLLRAPHNDFLMIMSNMQHTNKLVKALVTHVRVLEFAASTNRSFIDYSSILSSTRRKRKRKQTKSTTTTNLTNPFPRRTRRPKRRTRATQRNEISPFFVRDLALSIFCTKLPPNSPLKYFIRFISPSLAPRHLRAACCTFTAISVTQSFHYISGLTYTLHSIGLWYSSPIMLLPICLSVVGTWHHLLVAGDPSDPLHQSYSAGRA